jgi:hypothetical protein
MEYNHPLVRYLDNNHPELSKTLKNANTIIQYTVDGIVLSVTIGFTFLLIRDPKLIYRTGIQTNMKLLLLYWIIRKG